MPCMLRELVRGVRGCSAAEAVGRYVRFHHVIFAFSLFFGFLFVSCIAQFIVSTVQRMMN